MALSSLSRNANQMQEARRRAATKSQRRETLVAYLFLAPYLVVLLVFTVLVGLYGIGLSLFRVDIGFTAPEFIGLRNYQNLFQQLT